MVLVFDSKVLYAHDLGFRVDGLGSRVWGFCMGYLVSIPNLCTHAGTHAGRHAGRQAGRQAGKHASTHVRTHARTPARTHTTLTNLDEITVLQLTQTLAVILVLVSISELN